jgi:hypothetical protein
VIFPLNISQSDYHKGSEKFGLEVSEYREGDLKEICGMGSKDLH